MQYDHIIKTIKKKIECSELIIGAGAGTGLSARSEEIGGVDLIIVYNSGRYRMAGRGSLAGLMPYGNANQIVKEMGNEILPVVKKTPVLAGVCGTDPFCNISLFLDELKALGFSGIQNFPTVGLIDGKFRQHLEETDMGYGLEVELIRLAHEKGMLTTPYVFGPDDAVAMTKAGADIIVVHLGLTIGGDIGACTSCDLETSISLINTCASAAKAIRDDIIVLCHGGPISEPKDVAYVLDSCPDCHGFYGASSIERLPTEMAIKDRVQNLKKLNRSNRISVQQNQEY
nr:phosphoenolpyruvate hydrolase family protein [Xenorhabdus sp. KJ12.1]